VSVGTWRSALVRRPTVVRPGRRVVHAGDRGAAAVEFALIVPILLILVFGIVDFGLAMFSQNMVGNAAREGARTASLGGTQAQTEQAATAAMTGIIGTKPTPTSGLVASCTYLDTSTTPASTRTCPGWTSTSGAVPAPSGATVKVTITYDYKWLTPIQIVKGVSSSMTFTRQSTMLVG
jgi:Flp pilus assembly protein TadG